MRDRLPDKQRLRRTVETSIKTAMIGGIAAFEEHFGYLWGAGKKPEDMTDNEAEFYSLWESARAQALNVGHNAIKIANKTVNSHNVEKKDFYQEFE